MRLPGCLTAALLVACLDPTYTYGQSGDQHRLAETIEPYHKHRDTRHGHDHFYPDRGSVIRDLPAGTIGVSYAGASYRYHDGVWLEPRGPAFIVVAPPIGLIVPTLPAFSTILAHDGRTYLYCNDTYYQPRPDLGGYEVINDPTNAQSQAGPDVFVGGVVPGSGAPSVQIAPAAHTATTSIIPATVPAGPAGSASSGIAVPVSAVAPPPVAAAASVTSPSSASPLVGSPPVAAPPVVSQSGLALASAVAPSPNATAAIAAPPQPASSAPASATAPPAPTQPAIAPLAAAPSTAALSATQTAALPKLPKIFAYPRNSQSADQQARDRYDCYRFAVAQSGFDPMHSTPGSTTTGSTTANAELQSDYDRAQAACFDARGYTIR